jgi:hypothetical protein
VPDLTPDAIRKLAACVRSLSADNNNERRAAWTGLCSLLKTDGIDFRDLGNLVESAVDDRYTKTEMLELSAAARKEGVETGIKIGEARASQNNGHITLPEPSEMAAYCYVNRGRLEEKHHSFVDRMSRRRSYHSLSPKEKGYLASLYIQLGGRT